MSRSIFPEIPLRIFSPSNEGYEALPTNHPRVKQRLSTKTLLFLSLCSFAFLWLLHSFLSSPEPDYSAWLVPTDGLLPELPQKHANIALKDFSDKDYTKPRVVEYMLLPPSFEQYHEYERNLPQHQWDEQPTAKYLYVGNHAWGSGFGNVLQDYVLNSFLALALDRTMVFDNYTWSTDMSKEFSEYAGKLIPSRIPISALLSGPLAGKPFLEGHPNPPPFISRAYFDEICQGRKRTYHTSEFKQNIPEWMDGKELFEAWRKEFAKIQEPCLEIDASSQEIFDIWLFGTPRMHSLSSLYMTSPLLDQFAFSPLVYAAFNANVRLFAPAPPPPSPTPSDTPQETADLVPEPWSSWPETPSLPGLLVLHIRRGDFDSHCRRIASWSSPFHGLNTMLMHNFSHTPQYGSEDYRLPEEGHPDKFSPPPGGGYGENTDGNYAIYQKRCYPGIQDVVAKVEKVRKSYEERNPTQKLDKIYIMTNGKKDWLDRLGVAIQTHANFTQPLTIYTSKALKLTHEQDLVSQALDMYVGARAEVFIGNGFSSLTSNVVVLRMARGVMPLDTRFW